MQLKDIMTTPVVQIRPEESVAVAARMLERNHIGAMPVCTQDGKLRGMITDRDIVVRCLASGRKPEETSVGEIMTGKVYVGRPDMDAGLAANLMGREQVRRLPVMDAGKLCGMVSVGDIARIEEMENAVKDALSGICSQMSRRG